MILQKRPVRQSYMTKAVNILRAITYAALTSIIGYYVVYAIFTAFICLYGCLTYGMHDASWTYMSKFITLLYHNDCVPALSHTPELMALCFIVILVFSFCGVIKHSLKYWLTVLFTAIVTILPIMLLTTNYYWESDVLTSPTGYGGDRSIEVFNCFRKIVTSHSGDPSLGWKIITLLMIPSGLTLVVIAKFTSLHFTIMRRLVKTSLYGFIVMLIPITIFSCLLGIATSSPDSLTILIYSTLQSLYYFFRYGIFFVFYSTVLLSLLCLCPCKDWILKHNIIVPIILGLMMISALFLDAYFEPY